VRSSTDDEAIGVAIGTNAQLRRVRISWCRASTGPGRSL